MNFLIFKKKKWESEKPEYPYFHRCLEVFSTVAFIVTCIGMVWINVRLSNGLSLILTVSILTFSTVLAYFTADFISGLIHFVCDNFGTPDTPIVGKHFIRPFREHHDHPLDITKHDFIETNGNNFLVCFAGLLIIFLLVLGKQGSEWLFLANFMLFLGIFLSLTNQFHKWAHQTEVPALIEHLQRSGIILGADNHGIHHAPPYKKYYCITSGSLNPLLNKIRFFERLYDLLYQGMAR